MSEKKDIHSSRNIPILFRAREFLDNQCKYTVKDTMSIIEELTEFEKEVRNLRQSIFEVAHSNFSIELNKTIKKKSK